MNQFKNHFLLGYLKKTHGLKGHLSLFMDVDDPSVYAEIDALFIRVKNNLVPYLIESIRFEKNNVFTIKLQDVDHVNDASKFTNSECYLPIELLPKLEGNKFYYHEINGFEVIDTNHGSLGKVDKVLDFPHQAIIQTTKNDKEVLIPISDDIIKKLDRESKQIHVETPEGLVDIYLNQ